MEIRPADWPRDEALLASIRRRVFIEEQNVPEALEWDGEDAAALHWLAYQNGEAVGTVRLLRDGHIGRMAVLAQGRGHGVGAALLAAALAGAEACGQREVYLHAQTHALGFYERQGFIAEGPEFLDAGILHRTMRKLLRRERQLGHDHGRFSARDPAAVALDLARQCQRQLRILSNSLEPEFYDHPEFAAAVSALARRSRHTEIRLLIVDGRPLARRGHALLDLHRRLPSAIGLRRVTCESADIVENYLIADDRGLLCLALREPEQAWADYNNRPLAEDYAERFDQLWHRAEADPELRVLHL